MQSLKASRASFRMAVDCTLLVRPNGSKLWRFRYRFAGRENMLALGAFPTVTLVEARTKRDEARKLIAEGIALRGALLAPK